MLNYLRQHKWYREIFSNNLYYKINGTWIKDSGFKIGDRIENVDGPWRSLYFCDCGNELSHSDSYINNDDESFGFQYEMYLLMGGSSFGDERFVESYYGRSIRCVKD